MSRTRAVAAFMTGALALAACGELAPVAAPDGMSASHTNDAPPSNSQLAELGRSIFFDATLSVNANLSCASCHDPNWGWTGPNPDINAHGSVYEGSIAGRFGNRKPPSSAYATVSPIFHFEKGLFVGGNFWDGRATGEKLGNPAADQAQGPFLNPLEQALAVPSDVVSRICAGSYAGAFRQVWGDEACDDPAMVDAAYDDVALSIAAYEASPESNAFTSKFDAYLTKAADLTQEEKRGLALFRGKGKCSHCHTLDKGAPLLTDFTYDNLGVPRNPENPFYGMTDVNPAGTNWVDPGLGGFLTSRADYAAYAEDAYGMQKVPTLRNVDLRPASGGTKAYSHNGYFKSLEGIVHFYNTRDVKARCPDWYTEAQALAQDCWPAPEVAANVNTKELGNLHLSPTEEAAIVAFLRTLSDGYQP